ncbi:MAG: hypothetical protein B6242_14060 [Anaerolineaceae bacterium 4572_78]|nr:MAG: hypothetical protein B6242_14060 [Anaerolineaceae bacterium 4572_78]
MIKKTTQSFYTQPTPEINYLITLRYTLIDIIVTLLILLFINLGLAWFLSYHTTKPSYMLVKTKWQLLENLQKPVDWLIVGDSTCNQGIIPKLLIETMAETGTGLNLCTIGGVGTIDDAWMIQSYIDRFGVPPQNILIIHGVVTWRLEPDPPYLAAIPNIRHLKKHGVPPFAMPFMSEVDLIRNQYLPLHTQLQTVKRSLKEYFSNTNHQSEKIYYIHPDGYMQFEIADPEYVEQHYQSRVIMFQNQPFYIADINRQMINHIIKLANQYQMNVYIIDAPIYERLYQHDAFQVHLNQLQPWLESMANQSEYVHYIPLVATFSKNEMENTDHIIHKAAIVYTKQAAELLKEKRYNLK